MSTTSGKARGGTTRHSKYRGGPTTSFKARLTENYVESSNESGTTLSGTVASNGTDDPILQSTTPRTIQNTTPTPNHVTVPRNQSRSSIHSEEDEEKSTLSTPTISTAQRDLLNNYTTTAADSRVCTNYDDEKQTVVRFTTRALWKVLKFINKESQLTDNGPKSLMAFVIKELSVKGSEEFKY